MKTKELTLGAANGLHLRVAGEIVKLVKSHDCQVQLSCNGCKHANACSILQLLTLGATKGDRIEASVEGGDEQEVIDRLSTLLGDGAGI